MLAIDEASGHPRGAPEPLTTPANWSGAFSLSRDDKRIAFETLDWRSTLQRAAFDPVAESIVGQPVPILRSTQPIRDHEVSPDGEQVAFTRAGTREDLFVARPHTERNSFTAGIEGPACDAAGNLYLVALKSPADIARVPPGGAPEVWVTLPGKSAGNGIVFDRAGLMYVADYTGHNVLRIDPKTKAVAVFAHEPAMNQPNDAEAPTRPVNSAGRQALAMRPSSSRSFQTIQPSMSRVWKTMTKASVTAACIMKFGPPNASEAAR